MVYQWSSWRSLQLYKVAIYWTRTFSVKTVSHQCDVEMWVWSLKVLSRSKAQHIRESLTFITLMMSDFKTNIMFFCHAKYLTGWLASQTNTDHYIDSYFSSKSKMNSSLTNISLSIHGLTGLFKCKSSSSWVLSLMFMESVQCSRGHNSQFTIISMSCDSKDFQFFCKIFFFFAKCF